LTSSLIGPPIAAYSVTVPQIMLQLLPQSHATSIVNDEKWQHAWTGYHSGHTGLEPVQVNSYGGPHSPPQPQTRCSCTTNLPTTPPVHDTKPSHRKGFNGARQWSPISPPHHTIGGDGRLPHKSDRRHWQDTTSSLKHGFPCSPARDWHALSTGVEAEGLDRHISLVSATGTVIARAVARW
jgi:hypothetical protein